jgi:hypothetical protein
LADESGYFDAEAGKAMENYRIYSIAGTFGCADSVTESSRERFSGKKRAHEFRAPFINL